MTAEGRKHSRSRSKTGKPTREQAKRAAPPPAPPAPPAAPPAAPREERPPDEVDEASRESFPASDAPSWTPLHAGRPRTNRNRKR